jgi:hypothetical protein
MTWVLNREKGKDPLALLGPNMRFAILWTRYDRRISGRPRNIDITDYRAGMTRHLLGSNGQLDPHDRASRVNHFLDWSGIDRRTGDPAEIVAASDALGLTSGEF